MKPTLVELIDMARQHAEYVLIKRHQPMIPSWVYVDEDDQLHVLATPWSNDEQKASAARHVAWLMRKSKASAYSLVVEAWTATAPEGWKPGEDFGDRPCDRRDRGEVVIAFATDGTNIEWKAWQTTRDWTERVIKLQERPFHPDTLYSWMSKLLLK